MAVYVQGVYRESRDRTYIEHCAHGVFSLGACVYSMGLQGGTGAFAAVSCYCAERVSGEHATDSVAGRKLQRTWDLLLRSGCCASGVNVLGALRPCVIFLHCLLPVCCNQEKLAALETTCCIVCCSMKKGGRKNVLMFQLLCISNHRLF